eukprot:m.137324 g.137324  ORF g.137324 m.137324 type:complete len:478 (+) comp14751_c0_seq4:210-1643(+)
MASTINAEGVGKMMDDFLAKEEEEKKVDDGAAEQNIEENEKETVKRRRRLIRRENEHARSPTLYDDVCLRISRQSHETSEDDMKTIMENWEEQAKPYIFRFGANSNIPVSLQKTVKKMRMGDVVHFRMFPSKLTTGPIKHDNSTPFQGVVSERFQESIEPNGNEWCTVKLVNIISPIDVTGDGGMMKYIDIVGESDTPAVDSGVVRARIRCTCKNEDEGEAHVFCDMWEAPREVEVGLEATSVVEPLISAHGTVGPGMDILDDSIRTVLSGMHKGEKCVVSIDPSYAFGALGCEHFHTSADAAVQVELELVDIVKQGKSLEEQVPEHRIQVAEDCKGIANNLFREGKYNEALRVYSKTLSVLSQDYRWVPEIKETSRLIKMAVTLNVAMCQLKLKNYKDVLGICAELIKQDSECVKAYYRMGQAHYALQDYREARKAYETSLTLDPTLTSAKKAVDECKRMEKIQDEKDRAKYKNMF